MILSVSMINKKRGEDAAAERLVDGSPHDAADADGERDAAAAVGEGKGEDGGEGNTTVPNDADRYEPPPPRPPNPVLFVGDIISSNMARAYYAGIVLKDIYGVPQLIQKGDTVVLQASPGELPYICQCRELWREIKSGEPFMRGVWFYRLSDVPEDTPIPQELVDSEPPQIAIEPEALASDAKSDIVGDGSREASGGAEDPSEAEGHGDDNIQGSKQKTVANEDQDPVQAEEQDPIEELAQNQDNGGDDDDGSNDDDGYQDQDQEQPAFVNEVDVEPPIRNLLLSSEKFINSAETILAKATICYVNNTAEERATKLEQARLQRLQVRKFCREMGHRYGDRYLPVLFRCGHHYRSRCYDPAKRIVKFSENGSKVQTPADRRVELLTRSVSNPEEVQRLIDSAKYIQKPYRRKLKKIPKKKREKKKKKPKPVKVRKPKAKKPEKPHKLTREERKQLARKEKEMAMLSEVPEPEPLQGLVEGSFVSVCKEDLRASERMPADFLCDGGLCHEVAEGGEGSWASDGGGDLGTAFTMVEKARQRQVLENKLTCAYADGSLACHVIRYLGTPVPGTVPGTEYPGAGTYRGWGGRGQRQKMKCREQT